MYNDTDAKERLLFVMCDRVGDEQVYVETTK